MYRVEVVRLLNFQSFYKVFHIINNILEQNWEEIFVICDRQKVDTRPKTERCWMMCTSCSINVCRFALDPLCMVASNAVGRKFASYLPFTWVTLFPLLKSSPRCDVWKEGLGKWWGHQDGPCWVRAVPLYEEAEDMTSFLCDSTRNSILCTLA